MPFAPWHTVPPTTPLRDLLTTSLLIHDRHSASAMLVRCSPGMEEGSATVVLATTQRPNALSMLGVDDGGQIGHHAQELLDTRHVQVVAIPHIAWKSVGRGLRWRTPVAVGAALLATALLYVPVALTLWWALAAGVAVGVVMWFLLRERTGTRVTTPDGATMSVEEVVRRAVPAGSSTPRVAPVASSRPSDQSRRWASPLR